MEEDSDELSPLESEPDDDASEPDDPWEDSGAFEPVSVFFSPFSPFLSSFLSPPDVALERRESVS